MTKKEEKREPQQTELAQTIGGYINNHSIIMYNSPTIHCFSSRTTACTTKQEEDEMRPFKLCTRVLKIKLCGNSVYFHSSVLVCVSEKDG